MSQSDYDFSRVYSNNIWYDSPWPQDRYKRFVGWQNNIYNPKPTMVTRNKIYGKRDIVDGGAKRPKIISDYNNVYDLSFYGKGDDTDAIVFYDEYKGRKRINIFAHGYKNEKYFGDEGGRLIISNKYFDGNNLASMSKVLYNKSPFDSIRIIGCYSGDGGEDSLISKLSAALRMPVKGYEGKVEGPNLDAISRYRKNNGTEATRQLLVDNQVLERSKRVNEVIRGSGLYAREGKTVMAGMEFF